MARKGAYTLSTYTVEKMRVIRPSEKVAEKNPDRFATVYGVFYNPDGEKLSILQKEITFADAQDESTVIDLENGILTLPSGQRGRKPVESISQDELMADLAKLRA